MCITASNNHRQISLDVKPQKPSQSGGLLHREMDFSVSALLNTKQSGSDTTQPRHLVSPLLRPHDHTHGYNISNPSSHHRQERHRHRTTIANQNQQLLQLLSFPPTLTPKNAGAMTYHNIHIKRILSLHQVAHRSVHHPKTPLNQMKKKQLREEKRARRKEKGDS